MKRTQLRRRTPLKATTTLARGGPLPRGAKLKAVSDKRRKVLDGPYRAAKAEVETRAGGRCELATPVCVGQGVEPHHLKGRVGRLLCDVEWMAWACGPCHDLAHSAGARAYVEGWKASRLGGAA